MVQVRNLSFMYPTRTESFALKNIAIVAIPGETIALVGKSGAGKSTLLDLLMRFYKLHGSKNKGDILLDGVNIERCCKSVNQRKLRLFYKRRSW